MRKDDYTAQIFTGRFALRILRAPAILLSVTATSPQSSFNQTPERSRIEGATACPGG